MPKDDRETHSGQIDVGRSKSKKNKKNCKMVLARGIYSWNGGAFNAAAALGNDPVESLMTESESPRTFHRTGII